MKEKERLENRDDIRLSNGNDKSTPEETTEELRRKIIQRLRCLDIEHLHILAEEINQINGQAKP